MADNNSGLPIVRSVFVEASLYTKHAVRQLPGNPRCSGLAVLLVAALSLSLPSAIAGVSHRPVMLAVAPGEAPRKWLAQQTPSPADASRELQELIRQADALEANAAYAQVERLRLQILSITEKALGPEHPDTATSLSNLASAYILQTNSSAAESLLQRLNQSQASWLRRELPLQPREQRRFLISQQPDAPGTTFALLDQSSAAALLALDTRLNRQGLLAEIERRQTLLKGSSPETRQLAEQVAGIDRQLGLSPQPRSSSSPPLPGWWSRCARRRAPRGHRACEGSVAGPPHR
jgi:hypothetical protein